MIYIRDHEWRGGQKPIAVSYDSVVGRWSRNYADRDASRMEGWSDITDIGWASIMCNLLTVAILGVEEEGYIGENCWREWFADNLKLSAWSCGIERRWQNLDKLQSSILRLSNKVSELILCVQELHYTRCLTLQHENRNFSEMREYFCTKFCSSVLHITVHESVVSCCIYLTYAEMTETST